jgi:2-dehydropantoate 2-reductase
MSVIGGGAVGGLLAALLARAGCSVELVVREQSQAAYRDGVRVTTPRGVFRQALAVRTAPSPMAVLLIVAVKMPDLETTCRQLAAAWSGPAARAGVAAAAVPAMLLLQNGLEALDLAAHFWPAERLHAAVVELGATAFVPGEVTYAIPGRLLLGPAQRGQEAAARQIAAWLTPALRADVTQDVRGAQRLKLLVNLNNGVAAATGLTIQQLYASRAGVSISLGVMREGLAVLDAAGIAPPVNRRSLALRAVLGLPDVFGLSALRLARIGMRQRAPVFSSTLQSLLRHRPSEIRWLNGAIVRLATEYNLPAPLNGAIVAVVEAMEGGQAGPAFVRPSALLATGGQAGRPVRYGAVRE